MSLPQQYNLLCNHPNEHYIETGIWRGDSLQMALEAGFTSIFGIDNDEESVKFCIDRFDLKYSGLPMKLSHGNSPDILPYVLKDLEGRATILLDAHWQLTGDKPENAFPLMRELTAIMNSDRMNDTIIIDDLLYMTHPQVTGWKLHDIVQALRRINTHYKIEFLANPVVNNLLIAHP